MNWKDQIPQPTDEQYNKFLTNMKKPDKKQYNLRLSEDVLKRLQALSIENDTSVSHEIRTAVKKHLKAKR